MSFRFKTILGIASIEAVLLLTLLFNSLAYLRESNRDELRRRAETSAKLFATAARDAVLSTDLARLQELVQDFLKSSSILFVRVVDRDRVLAQGGDGAALARPFVEDKDIAEVDDGVLDTVAIIRVGGETYGRVELGLSVAAIEAIVTEARGRIVALASLEIGLVALFSWLLGSYLTRQLRDLEEASLAVAEGDFNLHLPVRGKDELARMAQAFNTMSASIGNAHLQWQRALEEAERRGEQLQAVVDAELDGIVAIDRHGVITLFSRAAENIFGYSAGDVMGRNISMLMPEPHRSKHDDYLRNYLETGQRHIIGIGREVVGQREDGSLFPLELSVTELFSSQGQGYIGLVRDLTERKQLEEQSRHDEIRYRSLLKTATDGIHILDGQGNLLEASDSFYRMLGYPSGTSLNVADWDAQWNREELLAFIPVLMQSYQVFETRHKRSDGGIIDVEVAAQGVHIGDEPLLFASSRDITQRKRVEEQLRASERMKSSMLESSLDAIVTIDSDGLIREFNQAAVAIFGYTRDEAMGKSLDELLLPERYRQAHRNGMRHFLASGEGPVLGIRFEITALRKRGEEFPVELAITPISQGTTYFFTAFLRDITERKQTEKALLLASEQAEQASHAKSQFLAVMSHEMRTPLNALLGIQELLADTALDEKQRQYLRMAQEAGGALTLLIGDILDLTKIEAGKLEVERLPMKPADVLAEVMGLLRKQADEKGLTLTSHLAPDVPPVVVGDPARLRQVLFNLVGNAVKFTARGGVAVRVSRSKEPACGMLQFDVSDTGIGIAEEVRPRLFNLFMQADPSDTRKYGGSGLGLAISKRLVDLWGGRMGLRSQLGAGSRFWFTFGVPADDMEPAAVPGIEAENASSLVVQASVLLVEDSPLNQVVISTMLRQGGYVVDVADCGAAAIDAMKGKRYDLVFMDVSMPGMDGMEATRRIRRLGGAASTVPIVAMTAHAVQGYREQCLEAGMNDYATKPIRKQDLMAMAAKWVGVVASPSIAKEAVSPLDSKQFELVDGGVIRQVASDAGLEDVAGLVRIFMEELMQRRDAIVRALAEDDMATLHHEGHSLKSAAGTFGALPLQTLAVEVDACCKRGDLGAAKSAAKKLLTCADATLAELKCRSSDMI